MNPQRWIKAELVRLVNHAPALNRRGRRSMSSWPLYLGEHDLASSVEKTGTALLLDEPFAIRGEARALSVQEAW